MKNTVTAQIEFDFKGKHFSPSTLVDLDEFMRTQGHVPDLRGLVATSNHVSPYSYEFEVMEVSPLVISQSEGWVSQFISDDKQLDIEGFEKQWLENKVITGLQEIASKHLNLNDLSQDEAIKQALWDAYVLGKDSR